MNEYWSDSLLGRRLLGSLGLIVPSVMLCWLDSQHHGGLPGIWVGPVVALIGCLATIEVLRLGRNIDQGLSIWPAALATVGVILSSVVPYWLGANVSFWPTVDPATCPFGYWGWTALATIAGTVLILAYEMRCYRGPGGATVRVALQVFAMVYVGLSLACLMQVRLLPGSELGVLALVSVVFVAKWADAGAYFVGKSLGRNRLAPVLSPGKTIEGAVGGCAAAVLAACLWFGCLAPLLGGPKGDLSPTGWLAVAAYGLALASAGMLGDLAESLLKRDVEVKDSAGSIPGLGGMLDVIDSLLLATPVAYLVRRRLVGVARSRLARAISKPVCAALTIVS